MSITQKFSQLDRNKVIVVIKHITQRLIELANKPMGLPIAFLLYQGMELIVQGMMTTIQGKAGSHKSHAAQEMAIALLREKGYTNDIGMVKSIEEPVYVIYIDTERDMSYEFPVAIKTMSDSAGIPIPSKYFTYISLNNFERSERIFVIQVLLEEIRKEYAGEICVFIDVATDLISDFNSVTETLQLQDLFKQWLEEFAIALVTIIHENPKGEKMRGHIGTELLNKASNSLRTTLQGDVITIHHVKCRNRKLVPNLNARYNSDNNRLELVSMVNVSGQGKNAFIQLLVGLFSRAPRQTRQDIMNHTESLSKGVDQRDNYLKEIKNLSINGHNYELISEKDGKETVYLIREFPKVQAG